MTPEGARSTDEMMARAAELRQFESDYQAAWSQFGSGMSLGNPYMNARNPFRRAFLDRADPNDMVGEEPSDGGADNGDSPSGTDSPPEIPNPPPVPPPVPPPPPPAGPDPVPPAPRPRPFRPWVGTIDPDPGFDFVVVGDYGTGGSAKHVYRARRDARNRFHLENDRTFTIWANPEGYRVVDEDEIVVLVDLNRDGELDLVRAINGLVGSQLEIQLGDGSGQFELLAQGHLLRRQILSLAVYEFSGDREADVVLVTDSGPGLTIYIRDGERLVHYKDLALSFQPGLVMTSNIRPRDERLYVLDREMTQARMYSTRYRDGQLRRIPFPSDVIYTLELESLAGEADRQISVFEDIGSFAIFEQTEQGSVLYSAFPREHYPDLIILGDYFRLDSRQMVIWW